MGLDISIRFVRKGAKPTKKNPWTGEPDYEDKDWHVGPDYSGRSAFRAVQKWIGDDNYGKYVPLDDEKYISLKNAIEIAMVRQHDIDVLEENEDPDDFPAWLEPQTWGLTELYQYLLLRPAFEALGWQMQIEADW